MTLSQLYPGQMLPVRAIPLTGKYGDGHHAVVDPEDYPLVRWLTWNVQHARLNKGRALYPLAWVPRLNQNMTLAQWLTGWEMTGNINGDTFDCRRVNLVKLDPGMRQFIRPPMGGASRFKGVCRKKTKTGTYRWRGYVNYRGYRYELGLFDEEQDAARAYDKKLTELAGDYAMTNQKLGLFRVDQHE